ncbi:MAG: hypothetical protein ABSB63_21860 [Spirochaetia bacterium]
MKPRLDNKQNLSAGQKQSALKRILKGVDEKDDQANVAYLVLMAAGVIGTDAEIKKARRMWRVLQQQQFPEMLSRYAQAGRFYPQQKVERLLKDLPDEAAVIRVLEDWTQRRQRSKQIPWRGTQAQLLHLIAGLIAEGWVEQRIWSTYASTIAHCFFDDKHEKAFNENQLRVVWKRIKLKESSKKDLAASDRIFKIVKGK